MPTSRSAAKYRLYGSEALRKVHFVRSAQAVGFALDDIAALFALDKAKGTCCQVQVRELLEKRLAETEDRLRDLERVRSALRDALKRCKASGDDDCAVMLDLTSPAVESAPANGRVRTPRTGGEAVRPSKTVPK
jgi:DNA-binding transcriptional MerR regulator